MTTKPIIRSALGGAVFAVIVSSPAALAQIDVPSLYSDPAKFTLYGCAQLDVARPALVGRKAELEGLMAKSAAGSGGRAVNVMAYQSEYQMVVGDLGYLEKRAATLKCPPPKRQQEQPQRLRLR